jgi:sec-independent protein translocase protein TatB
VFGISFPEFLVLGTVALLVLGPEKLPGMLRTLGQWLAKLRKLTTEVRNQSGIDDVLRSEGLEGGLNELRGLVRGGLSGSVLSHSPMQPTRSVVPDHFAPDKSREYPVEGSDAYGALPEDLLPSNSAPAAPAAALASPAAEPLALAPEEAPVPSPEGPAGDASNPGAVP